MNRENRMSGTSLVWRRESFIALFGRWLSGDWWRLEAKDGAWGVWHPWRRHVWENCRFSKQDAVKEQRRLNSGMDYEICEQCGCTYASHKNGQLGGIECP